jgi:uncharacterized membrane protein
VISTLSVLALVLTGLVAGTLTAGVVAVKPALHSLSPTSYITVKQAFDRSYPRLMKPLQLTALAACLALTAAAAADGAGRCATWSGSATLLVAVNILVTVRGDVPINILMASWRPEAMPIDWQRHRTRWDIFNNVRTLAAVVALVLLSLAVVAPH